MRQISRLRAAVVASASLVVLALSPDVAAQGRRNAAPSAGLQKEFDEFITKFRAALKINDAAAVTAMTKLPFLYANSMIDAAQFRAKAYPVYFTGNTRTCIQRNRAVHDRDGQGNDNYFIFCGQRIFVFTKTPTGFLFSEVGVND